MQTLFESPRLASTSSFCYPNLEHPNFEALTLTLPFISKTRLTAVPSYPDVACSVVMVPSLSNAAGMSLALRGSASRKLTYRSIR